MPLTTGAAALHAFAHDANLVCGAGGSRAILGGTGVIIAGHLAGIEKWRSAGGASGGSIPTLLLAGGVHPSKILRLTIETDFSSLLTRHASPVRMFLTYFLKDNYYRIVRPERGLFSSEKVGRFVETHVPEWPEGYWTVAAWGSSQVLFNGEGVFEYTPRGRCRVISCKPAPVGIAVRASCAIPGVFDAIRYQGMLLCDGALSVDGRTPVGAIKRHLGIAPERILALDVGEVAVERSGLSQALWDFLWRLVCGRHCPDEGPAPHGAEGIILVKPTDMQIRYLQFKLTSDQKWHTVMCGFRAAVNSLEAAGIIGGARLAVAHEILRSFDDYCRTSTSPGDLAARTEALLASHGLY